MAGKSLFWDFTQALDFVASFCWNNGDGYAFTPGTWNGYRTLVISKPAVPGFTPVTVVCLQVAADELINFRAIARGGPVGVYQAVFAPDTPPGGPGSYATFAARFTEVVLAKRAMIDAWTNGSCGLTGVQDSSAAGGLAVSGTWFTPVLTDAESFVTEDKLFYTRGSEEEGIFEGYPAPPMTPGPGVGVVGGPDPGSVSRIAQALEDISKMSRVTWVNNQGGFADIATSDIITPGG